MYTDNLLDSHDTTGWGDGGTPNQNWPFSWPRNVSAPWHDAIPGRPDYMSRIPENVCAAARRVHDDWLRGRRCTRIRSPSTSRNPVRNPRINRRGDDRVGPVDQYFLLQFYVSSVSNLSFLSVTCVSIYLCIACRITFCVIFV